MHPTATPIKRTRERYHSQHETKWMPAIQLAPNLQITYINYRGSKQQALDYATTIVQQLKGIKR